MNVTPFFPIANQILLNLVHTIYDGVNKHTRGKLPGVFHKHICGMLINVSFIELYSVQVVFQGLLKNFTCPY